MYFPDLSTTDNEFFMHLDTFLMHSTKKQKSCPKGEVDTAFKDFFTSKTLEFYRTGKNNLFDRWQKS